jgi:hypothetical protein
MFRSQKVYIRPVNKGRVNALEEAAIFSARILIKIGLRSWAVGRFKDKAEIEREKKEKEKVRLQICLPARKDPHKESLTEVGTCNFTNMRASSDLATPGSEWEW